MAAPETNRREVIYLLAARAEVHLRTAERAYELGPSAIRGRVVRERVRAAMLELGLPTEADNG